MKAIAKTVGQLIEALQQYPPDMLVIHGDSECPSPGCGIERYTPTTWDSEEHDLPTIESVLIT